MTEPIVLKKAQPKLRGKTAWILAGVCGAVLVGMMIQVRMTWSRESLRGVTSDASEAIQYARDGIVSIIPPKGPLISILDSIRAFRSTLSTPSP